MPRVLLASGGGVDAWSRVRRTVRSRPSAVSVAVYAVALLAWVAVLGRWFPTSGSGMAAGMSQPGGPEAMALRSGPGGVARYLVMWGTMMVAMMFPSSTPLLRAYRGTLAEASRGAVAVRVGVLLGTYAVVWALTGVVPLLVNSVFPLAALSRTGRLLVVAGALVLLGAYQLSSRKRACLRQCHSPVGFLLAHYAPGMRGAATLGGWFAYYCLGCCWALMGLLVVVGSMNLLWMGLITVVVTVERVVPRGEAFARATGVVALTSGIVVAAVGLG